MHEEHAFLSERSECLPGRPIA
ncbi:hypothetical protein XBI1_2070003 [Xenorhabdus bovienii str. Intermedium]|uniref:Uncharacterized protein n=1 Tax=Xenorhabdus bovienii str. Intermedium TaxID=1379677 RepID=A0A077Q8Y6_XENBV|nr:hypothetical protein XBI1_2070003 [Xenorhabdus bovienii str. Intermedium]